MALGTLQGSNSGAMNNIAKPGCQTHCGNITVPYPFGIGKDTGCSLDSSFYVNCSTSFDPPKLFIKSGNVEIYNISDSELRIFTSVSHRCYAQNGNVYSKGDAWTDLAGLFTFSEKNKLTVIGCDDYALITGSSYSSGCFGLCSKSSDVDEGECSGKGCCQTSITKGLTYYNVTLNTFNQHINVSEFNECGYAFLSEEGSFRFGGAKDLSATNIDLFNSIQSSVPVVLDWVIAPAVRKCADQANECKGKSHCYDVDGGGYRCRCNQGYEGNPYLDQGCQDIDECKDPEKYPCHGICINTPGNYTCKCKKGYSGDAMIRGGCQRKPVQTLLFSLVLYDIGENSHMELESEAMAEEDAFLVDDVE
ncbi:wall-associated receptor kinase 2-like protein, partial [Tanacetum coccineum]